MSSQMHKRLTDDQVKTVLDLYNKKTITLKQALQQLGCKRSRFYQILKKYRKDPEGFTIAYARHYPQHRLSEYEDWVIRGELKMDRKLIADKNTPIKGYNYAAVRDKVVKRLGYKISTQIVRNRQLYLPDGLDECKKEAPLLYPYYIHITRVYGGMFNYIW